MTAFDNHCLAISEAVLLPLFPPALSERLRGPLARLALEHAAIGRRYTAARDQAASSARSRGLNPTLVTSQLAALTHDEEEAKTNLVDRWLGELTAEQAAVLDAARFGQAESGRADEAEASRIESRGTPDEREDEGTRPRLSARQENILETMLARGAVDRDNRVSRAVIVACINQRNKVSSYRRAFDELSQAGYTQGEPGAEGGIWLTSTGRERAEEVTRRNDATEE
jgi:hypothetical protein